MKLPKPRPVTQCLCKGLQHTIAAGMRDPMFYRRAFQSLLREHRIYVAAEIRADEIGDRGRELDLEAGIDHFPAHHRFRLGIKNRSRRYDPRSGYRTTIRNFTTPQDHCRTAIAKERRTDNIRYRSIAALKRERAQFYRHDHRNLIGKGAQDVSGAPDTRHTARTSQAEDWCTPYVLTHTEQIDDTRVDARGRNSGTGHEEQIVDIPGLHPRRLEGIACGGHGDFRRLLEPGGIGLGESIERQVIANRTREIAAMYVYRTLNLVKGCLPSARSGVLFAPMAAQQLGEHFLIHDVGWKCRANTQDSRNGK